MKRGPFGLLTRGCWTTIVISAAAGAAPAQTLVVDNPDSGFSVLSETWSTYSASGQWGDDYRYKLTDDPPGEVQWQADIPVTGDYAVAVWYRSTGTGRPNDARYTVHHADGSDDVFVDQQINGSTWVPLGAYPYDAGSTGRVTLTSDAEPGKTIVADAVFFRGPAEWRAMWAYSWGSSFLTPSETTSMINTLAAHNYNVVVPEIRKAGDAYYDSAYEPWATNLQPGYDALGDMIAKAHAAGIEVHAWIVTYRIWNNAWSPPPDHPFVVHPEWLCEDTAGNTLNGSNYYLDPGVPAVQDYILNVVMDIVSNYDVDGFNFDYIRYQEPVDGRPWGYNPISEQRFFDEYGVLPPTSSSSEWWDEWNQWRRNQVTDLVRRCYVHIMAVKPHVVVTTDNTTWGSIGDWTSSTPYTSVCQDWKGWMDEHIVDALLPMNYKDENTHGGQYRDWLDFAIANKNGRHAYCGQGAYLNTIADSITQISYARSAGSDGQCQYQYATTNDEGAPASSFFSAMSTQLYTQPVPTPPMPWKDSPTEGILAGTVTDASSPGDPIYGDWIYKATVDLSGPVSRTATTDATGFYAFLDLPPGTYSVAVSQAGFEPATATDRVVTAGAVNFTDLALDPVGGTSCSSAMLSDFEGYTPDAGVRVMFRDPGYSGSTSGDIEETPDMGEVTDDVSPYGGTNSYAAEWQWIDTDPQRWMRLTTSNAANVPNPTVDLRRPIRVRLRLDSGSLRFCVGVRETGTAVPIGADGGTTGTIEWIGATSVNNGAPQGRLVTADPGVWQTFVFDPKVDPILAFTGDGVLSTATNRGVLEHLGFAIVGDVGPYLVYIDDVEQLCAPGDHDGDGDVDLADFDEFAACVTAPGAGAIGEGCDVFDFAADVDVDLQDYAEFQRRFDGF